MPVPFDNICHVAEEKTIVNSPNISSLKAKDFVPTGQTEAAMQKNKAEAETETGTGTSSSTPSSSTGSSSELTSSLQSSSLSAPPLPTPSSSTTAAKSSAVATVSRNDPAEKRSAISYNDYVLQHEDLLEQYIHREHAGPHEAMLIEKYRAGHLFLVLDGVDEAPSLVDDLLLLVTGCQGVCSTCRTPIEPGQDRKEGLRGYTREYTHANPDDCRHTHQRCHTNIRHCLVTSRPEGIDDTAFGNFIQHVQNEAGQTTADTRPGPTTALAHVHEYTLEPYTWEQQKAVLHQQLADTEGSGAASPALTFVTNILRYTEARSGMDDVYGRLDPEDARRLGSDAHRNFDRTRGSEGVVQVGSTGEPIATCIEAHAAASSSCDEITAAMVRVSAAAGLQLVGTTPADLYAQGNSGVGLVMADVKKLARIEVKAQEYHDDPHLASPGPSYVLDMVRCTAVCADASQALAVLNGLDDPVHGLTIVRMKNYFWQLDDVHYRRLQCVVKKELDYSDGSSSSSSSSSAVPPYHLFEVQIQLKAIYDYRNAHMEIC